ncbi:MAG: hypothetical protein AAGF25_03710 [Pseudomonadota bacterium]
MNYVLKAVVIVAFAFMHVGSTWAFDPEKSTYDPELKFVITPYGAIMGDPAQFKNIGSQMVGFTHITASLVDGMGLTIMTSLIEPAQNDKPGSGDVLMLNPTQALAMVGALRKGPEWAEVAKENAVGEYAKDVEIILGEADSDHTKIVFVADADSNGSMHIEKRVSGVWKKFLFSINASQKLANSIEHHLLTMLEDQPAATPEGDAEKDKLFQ